MPVHHTAKGLEHRFKAEGSVKNGEDTLTKGIIEAASTLAAAGLRRADQHHRGCGINPTQELKDLMAGWPMVS